MDISKAKPRWITLSNTETYLVPHGKGLMILGGSIIFPTGTDAFVNAVAPATLGLAAGSHIAIAWIPSASSTFTYPLFYSGTDATLKQSAWSPTILMEGWTLIFGGDAAAKALLCILEFDV